MSKREELKWAEKKDRWLTSSESERYGGKHYPTYELRGFGPVYYVQVVQIEGKKGPKFFLTTNLGARKFINLEATDPAQACRTAAKFLIKELNRATREVTDGLRRLPAPGAVKKGKKRTGHVATLRVIDEPMGDW